MSQNLKIGKNIYIILENKVKFDEYSILEHWYAQDDVIIRCPILNTMTMDDGTLLYNIRFNNEIYQLPCYNSLEKLSNDNTNSNFSDIGCNVVKYGKICCDPNGNYCERLGNTKYFAYYNYNDAVKEYRRIFATRLNDVKDRLHELINNMSYIENHIYDDIAIDADKFDDAIKQYEIAKYGACCSN
jgi:hypothetical protein